MNARLLLLPAITLLPSAPAGSTEVPSLAAAMTVFDGEQTREVEIRLRPERRMTVFTADGQREAGLAADWPPHAANAGWLALAVGRRDDRMRFTIGGRGGPNILSELKWHAPAWEIRADGSWTHRTGATISGYLAYARTFADGAVRDSDYARDHRQAEFSRSLADARDSEMFDASLGLGWRLPLGGLGSLTPLVGVAHHESTYRSSNGRQVVSDAANAALLGIAWNMPLGPFDGLHSRYRPRRQGVWLGIDGEFKAAERLTLRAGIKRHWFDFKADANWNLRGDLAHPLSFRQRDDGRGWEAEAGAAIRLAGSHRLTLETNRRAMKTARGENTTFHYNGARSTIDLGETELASWSARLGYRYDF